MKYTNMIGKLKMFFWWLFVITMVLIILGLMGGFVLVDFYADVPLLSFIWLMMIPVMGYCINWVLGYICGDEYYNTGMVVEGYSVFDVIKTPKYYRRRMICYFVECFLLFLLFIRFITYFPAIDRLIFAAKYPAFADRYESSFGIGLPIVGIIATIVEIIICFIIGMSSYEQSNLKYKKEVKKTTSVKEKKIEKKKPIHKFKFENYPGLLEKYETFKAWYFKKYETFENEEDKNKTIEELNKSFEAIAEAVYNIFNEIKPTLTLKKKGEEFKWEEVIDKPFNELTPTQKLILVRLLDKLYKYILPKEYYNY